MTDDELENARARIIWTNVLECIDNASTEGLEGARAFAAEQDDPQFEMHMLFSVSTGLLSNFLLRFLGEERTRKMLSALLHDLELDAFTAQTLDQELQRLLETGFES